ncbi:MAG: NADH-quinone oxidoreductase subunit H [Acidobacteria bacterium]|nr:NADH-quinone oxidoreductase subunit H [Acidobacteriota bacterium]
MGVALSSLGVLLAVVISGAATLWAEGRLYHRFQWEEGPAYPAPADRDLKPDSNDTWLYPAAAVSAFLGVCWAMVVIPFSPSLMGSNLNIGLFYFIVVIDYVALGIAIGGWGANVHDTVEACYRAIAQLVSYVVPLGLAVLGPIMMARSLSTVSIVWAQQQSGLWYIVAQPHEFALYVTTALIQTYRAPFLEPFSNRINHGVLGLYGGWKALLWRISLGSLFFVVAAMGAVLYLGGYSGPWLPGPVWLVLKSIAIMFLMVWAGRRIRALSTADMLGLAWKILIPIGLLNVLIVGIEILLGVGQSPFR